MNQPNRIRSALAASVALVAAAVVAVPAMADAVDTPMTATVNYADLDLNHDAGIHALYGRIHAAAEKVCSPLSRRDAMLNGTWSACVDNATSRAVASTRVAALADLYAAKTGKSVSEKVASLTN